MESFHKLKIWVLLIFVAFFQLGQGFYLPGSYPHKYGIGDYLNVKVNSLTSIDTELPFSYYSLPFCQPKEGIKDSAENLGELLMGDRIENSPYRFKMYTNETEIFLCQTKPLSAEEYKLLKKRIDEMYQVNVILDNLPAIRYTKKEGFMLRWTGYPVGVKVKEGYYVFNHLKFTVLVHKYEETNVARVMGTGDAAKMIPTVGSDAPGYMVVGFEVVPCSFQHNANSIKKLNMYDKYPASISCDPGTVAMAVKENEPLTLSYEVSFGNETTSSGRQGEILLGARGARQGSSSPDERRVVGMEACCGRCISLLLIRHFCALWLEMELILGMAVVTILFAALGFMSPASRDTYNRMLFFYMILGIAAGYVAVRLWRTIFAVITRDGLGSRGKFRASSRHRIPHSHDFEFLIVGKSQRRSYPIFVVHRSHFDVVSLVLTYMHLCVEDWKWWWKSFFASGSVAIYIFLYSINYLIFDLKSLSGPVSATLYLGYSLFMVLAIMLATGTVGFLSSFWFVHYLFSSVKLD
ncbi:hypothetical protein DH2020_014288 [Rehmannia glutinosa]|uniref:Transmembrane 9 superfamily member n=1 Tax=Rehmannia glutinosa TaxID=99300 RepID=A0ABR0WXG8_REHGL